MLEGIFDPLKTLSRNIFGGKGEEPVFQEDLAGFVGKEFKRRQDERRIFELQWRLNLAFYEGNQYLDINTASWSLEEQPVLYDWQEREAFNHVAPNIETRISKLKRFRAVLKAKPGSADRADLHSAKIGTMLLKQNAADAKLPDKQAEEKIWLEICGTVFRKHIWNPTLGPVVGKIIAANEATGETTEQEIREGDMEIIVVPPQEIFPDSCYHSNLEDCKSLIHAKAYDIDDIKEIWGIEVTPEKTETEKLQRAMNGMGGLGYGQGGFFLYTAKLEHHAVVKEYMERPTKQYPEGRLILVAGGKTLYAGPLPYKVGDDGKPGIPLSMAVCLKRPGIFWGKTVLERLIPVQRRYNALRNRKAEYLNRVAIGQWSTEEDSVDMDVFEQNAGAPGAVHVYRKGSRPPTMVDNPSLPAAFETEEATLLNEFAILSGVSEISRQSQAPPGVKSGVALSIVQEQDDTRLSNTVENIERHEVESGKIRLRLFKQFVKAPRTLTSVGKNNVAEVIDWTGADIRAQDVIVDNFSALAESPAQKRQMVFDLLETGILNDPDTGQLDKEKRSKVFDMIELGEWESADDEDQLHISKAERENKALEQGEIPAAVNYDDHIIHISRHNKFRLTTDYEELLAQAPAVDQLFEAHVDMHLVYLQQQAMAAMQSQIAAAVSQEGQKEQEQG